VGRRGMKQGRKGERQKRKKRKKKRGRGRGTYHFFICCLKPFTYLISPKKSIKK
jgi:hypothetical protein